MVKTICIKTNNQISIDYLLENLQNIKLEKTRLSSHNFKTFNNIFVHYSGNNISRFLNLVSKTLVTLVLNNYQNTTINNILLHEYFYFDIYERSSILEISKKLLTDDFNFQKKIKKVLFKNFFNFFKYQSTLYLQGYLTFRMRDYIQILEELVDKSVQQYLLEKEYNDFISLLKIYVLSKPSMGESVHLIYNSHSPILLDSNKNIIKTELNLLNAKYLSDISFSSSDIILNTLLTILPEKIYIHLLDNKQDDFIQTLINIFGNRIFICQECNICKFYKYTLF